MKHKTDIREGHWMPRDAYGHEVTLQHIEDEMDMNENCGCQEDGPRLIRALQLKLGAGSQAARTDRMKGKP